MNSIVNDREAQLRYRQRRQLDLANCRHGLSQNDFSTLITVGHNLKGNGVSFGYPELSHLGQRLENAAKTANHQMASECLEQLEAWLARNRQL